MPHLVEPPDGLALSGHEFLGRGPWLDESGRNWSRLPSLVFRCARCGAHIRGDHATTYWCQCGAMHLDSDMFRFGSTLGDANILVYRVVAV
jgi:hypothetical protein